MKLIELVALIVHVIMAVSIIATILLQSGRVAGLSGLVSGGAEQIFGKRKGMDEALARYTIIIAVVFGVTSVILSRYHV